MIPYSNFFIENYHTYYEDIAERNLKSLRLITTLGFVMGILRKNSLRRPRAIFKHAPGAAGGQMGNGENL